jgi:hypothetical protein
MKTVNIFNHILVSVKSNPSLAFTECLWPPHYHFLLTDLITRDTYQTSGTLSIAYKETKFFNLVFETFPRLTVICF